MKPFPKFVTCLAWGLGTAMMLFTPVDRAIAQSPPRGFTSYQEPQAVRSGWSAAPRLQPAVDQNVPVANPEPMGFQPPVARLTSERSTSPSLAPREQLPQTMTSGAPVQIGYRSTAPRMAQAPSWQQRPDPQVARRTMGTPGHAVAATIFPFEEDQAETVNPGQRAPAQTDGAIVYEQDGMPEADGYYPYPQDDFNPDGWTDGDWTEEGVCYGGACGLRRRRCDGPDVMACERFAACSWLSLLNESSLGFGVQGFKTPLDFGRNGNFGFNQSINLSDSIWHSMGIGYQLGLRFTESNFSGDQVAGVARSQTRYQNFVTAGLFHRAFYGVGWQYGVVVDYLNDRYYVLSDLYQVRMELSHVWANGREFGFNGIFGTQDNPLVFNGVNRTVRTIDQYRAFYRVNFDSGAFWRVAAGGTKANGTQAAWLGGDFRIPITNRFDIVGNWNYMIPTQTGVPGGVAEGWNTAMALAFYPGRRAVGVHNGPYRQLFDTADNGTFMTRLTTP